MLLPRDPLLLLQGRPGINELDVVVGVVVAVAVVATATPACLKENDVGVRDGLPDAKATTGEEMKSNKGDAEADVKQV